MLELKKIHSGYGKLKILKGVDFVVNAGEIVAIIGPNGAGKSTLLKTIFNLCDTYSGKVIFKDRDISNLGTHKLIYDGISYVPQGRQVFADLTVKENLEMGAFTLNDKEIVKQNLKEAYNKFPFLKEKRNKLAYTLSGGQQQMLAIARSLMQNPTILMLDEPSLGLSPKMMKEIFKKIVQINKEGTAIIIVEQNAKQAVSIADRTYILEDGKIALEGGKSILKDKRIKNIYFGGR